MKLIETKLEGVVIIEDNIYRDDRGYFLELWHGNRYAQAGLAGSFTQDNVSFSHRKVLRGLHYQYPNAQAKLVTVLSGEIYDVVVDIRSGSATFGQWLGVKLTSARKEQLYVPRGYAHGFCVTSEHALVVYKCDEFYSPNDEHTILWSDEDLNITWPFHDPIISDKDAKGFKLADIPHAELPDV